MLDRKLSARCYAYEHRYCASVIRLKGKNKDHRPCQCVCHGGDVTPSRARAQYARMMLRDILGGKCAKCGATEDLEIDHIWPGDGRKDRENGINDNHKLWSRYSKDRDRLRKTLQLLCKPCHRAKTSQERQCKRQGGQIPLLM